MIPNIAERIFYKCLTARSSEELQDKVQSALDSGYRLHGDTRMAVTGATIVYMQAMVLSRYVPKKQFEEGSK